MLIGWGGERLLVTYLRGAPNKSNEGRALNIRPPSPLLFFRIRTLSRHNNKGKDQSSKIGIMAEPLVNSVYLTLLPSLSPLQ